MSQCDSFYFLKRRPNSKVQQNGFNSHEQGNNFNIIPLCAYLLFTFKFGLQNISLIKQEVWTQKLYFHDPI